MNKPLLTIITDWYWPNHGGIETLTQTLASGISKYYKVKILTHPAPNQKTLYQTYTTTFPYPQTDPAGNSILYLRASVLDRFLLLPLLIREIPKIGKSVRIYDLLYVFYRMVFYSRLKKLLTVPQKTSIVHCFSTGYLARCVSEVCQDLRLALVHTPSIHSGRWGDSPAQMIAYVKADVVTFLSEYLKTVFLLKIRLPQGCSTRVIPPLSKELTSSDTHLPHPDKFILFLGRREKHKGLPMVLEALDRMKNRMHLVVAGPGEPKISECPQVTDLGVVDEATKGSLLKLCNILCVPSTDETFGIVYTEAMSCSKPIVALDIPPINEIVQNGVTGILVPPDDASALADALDRVGSDRELSENMGKRAYERFTAYYSSDRILENLEKMYRGLIERKGN